MAKYLFLVIPGHGHVNPTLAVAEELVSRGEEVIYYLPEQFREAVEATGASFHGYSTGLGKDNFPVPSLSGPTPGIFAQITVGEGRRVLPLLLEEIPTEGVDCLVYDRMCLWARIVVERLALPSVVLHASYVMNDRTREMLAAGGIAGRALWRERMAGVRDDLHRLCSDYGVPAMEPEEIFSHAGPLNIVFMPRAFQPGGESFDQRFVFVGPSIRPRHEPSDFPLDRLGSGPVLYVSLGTVFNDRPDFFQNCFDAFKDLPWHVVLSRGRRVDPAALGPVPQNLLVSPYVPQLELLSRARVFVTHGGMNSTMESLYFGVPMVVAPQMPEQAVTAARVQELGLGVELTAEQVNAAALRESVLRVDQDPSYRERVREMQRLAREAGGYRRAADAIQRFSRSQRKRRTPAQPISRKAAA